MSGSIAWQSPNGIHWIYAAALRGNLRRDAEQRYDDTHPRAAAHTRYLTLGARSETRSTRGTSK